MSDIPWSDGRWTHEPEGVEERDGDLLVTAVEGSDAWRTTSYGFVHDSEHALLAPLPQDSAVEVELTTAFTEQFDQGGVLVRVDSEHWVKAGVEYSDGACQLGAVVTAPVSDWSVAPVPEWTGRRVLVRVSRSGDALTVRAGVVELDESRHQAVDGEGDEQGDEDEDDDAPHGGLPLHLGQGQQHDLGGQDEVRGDGLADDLGLVDRSGALLRV